ncbi:MAG: SufE family protein [Bacteroidota bacterium]|nr:SufE family protein [Bacteroidota bacterium]
MTLKEVQDQIIEEFEIYEDWMDKYNYLIELSQGLPALDSKYKTREYLIEGCQSKVWLYAEMDGDVISYAADSDAIITKGIVALLIKVMSGRSPEELKNVDLFFIDKIGLKDNLSPTRANGLFSMVKQMKLYALAYFAKQQS